MADESIGGVVVQIGGDFSQMQRDFAAAQSAAQQAGATIATAFNGGAASASGLVDQFGRSIQSTATAASAAAPALSATSQAAQQLAASAAEASAAVTQSANALRGHTAAAHGSITEIQAISGTLRTFEGNSAFRATERFLTLIPGLGAALQTAFPVIGALALGETILKVIGHFGALSEAEKKLAEVTKQNDAEWERLANQLEKINVERITADFGKLAGLKLQAFYDEGTAERDRVELQNTQAQIELLQKTLQQTKNLYSGGLTGLSGLSSINKAFNPFIIGEQIGEYSSAGSEKDQQAKIKALQDTYATLQEKIRVFDAGQAKNREDQQRTGAGDSGRQASARIQNEEQLNQHLAELAKQRVQVAIDTSHAEAQAQIDALVSPQARAIAGAEEELRMARDKQAQLLAIAATTRDRSIALIGQRAGAESQGKTPQEQADIRIKAEGEVAAARDAYTKESLSMQAAVEAAAGKVSAAVVTGTREETKAEQEYGLELMRTEGLWDERATKYAAAQSKMEAARAKKQFEPKPEIEQTPITVPTSQRLGDNPAGLAAQLDQSVRITQIPAETPNAAQSRIAGMQDQLNLENALNVPLQERLSLEQQILQARIALATANGQTDNADKIAAANVALQQTLQQWKSVGLGNVAQDMAGAAVRLPGAIGGAAAAGILGHGKNSGVGEEVSRALKGVGQQLLGQVFTQTIQRLIVTILGNTVVQTIMHALLGTNVGVQAANTAASAANTAAHTAGTIVSAANTVAVVALTAAVTELATVETLKLFGFADGGSPPVGVPSIGGEVGPELFISHSTGKASVIGANGPQFFIPRESGSVVPNHMLKGYADGAALDLIGGVNVGMPIHVPASSGPQLPAAMRQPDVSQFRTYPNSSTSSSTSVGEIHFHLNNVRDGQQVVDHVMRKLPQALKTRSSQFSPYS